MFILKNVVLLPRIVRFFAANRWIKAMYLYKKIITLLLLAMSFLILCSDAAAQQNSYINSNDTTTELEKYNSKNTTLLEDIEILRKSLFIKNPLETKKEFEERKQILLVAEFLGKAYEIHLRINEMKDDDIFQHKKILAYDPETETMTIAFPRVEKKMIKIQHDGEEEDFNLQGIRLLIHEKFEDKRLKIPADKLGIVFKYGDIIKVYRSGIFIPASGSQGMIYKLTFPMSRSDAYSVLKDGEVVLRVLVDTQHLEYDSTPLLFEDDYIAEATTHPLISQVTMYMPARLSSISINDRNGIELFQEKGEKIIQPYSFVDKLLEWFDLN
jgi:hypothetical protein